MNKILLLCVAFSLFLVMPFASAYTCGLSSYNGIAITGCQSINITNAQSSATGSNFQLGNTIISFPTNALTGNYIIYDTGSSAPVYSWAENTGLVWVLLPSSIGAISSYNGLRIEYGKNFSNTGNFFYYGNGYVGVAPYIFSSYGQYDNGANIFSTYSAFGGLSSNSLPTGWTKNSAVTVVNYAANTIFWHSGGVDISNVLTSGLLSFPNLYEYYGNFYSPASSDTHYLTESTALAYLSADWTYGIEEVMQTNAGSLGVIGGTKAIAGDTNNNKIYTLVFPSSTTENVLVNYSTVNTLQTVSSKASLNYLLFAGGTSAEYHTIYWFRTRNYPPNGIMPIVSYGAYQPTLLAANTLLESNSIMDLSQYTTLTAGATGGSNSYTFNWFASASCGGSSVAGGVTYSPSISGAGTTTYSFNVVDSGGNVPVCSASNTIIAYIAPSSALSFTNAGGNSINYGTISIANDVISGGSGVFNSVWTLNNAWTANYAFASTQQTSNTMSWASVGAYVFNVVVTDMGTTTHYVVAQISNTLTVTKATPSLTLPSFPINFTWNNAYTTITATISTHNNQLSASDYVNGTLITSFTTSNTFTKIYPNTYLVTISTSGNANYISSTFSNTLLISKLSPILTLNNCGTQTMPYSCTENAAISSINGQLLATLYLNNNPLFTTNTAASYTVSNTLGAFNFLFSTTGNSNYTSNSVLASWIVSGSSTVTTTIPTITSTIATSRQIINETNLLTNNTSIPQIFSLTFLVPDVAEFIVFIVCGIEFMRSGKPHRAFAAGFIISSFIYLYVPNLINVAMPIGLGLMLFVSIAYALFTNKPKQTMQSPQH